ncbi:MAG: hypothetical protein MR455_02295, partial [Prevotella sp.]|nr:hypothetical protein [Prevotella sp.]
LKMLLILLFICLDFIVPATPGQGYANLHEKNVDNPGTKLVNAIWTKRGNRIVPKGDYFAWPKGAKLHGFSRQTLLLVQQMKLWKG